MTDYTRDLEFLRGLLTLSFLLSGSDRTHQNLKSPVETHLEVPLIVFDQHSQKTLLEDCGREGVGDGHEAVRSVRQRLHFE